jgi:2-C-methyl-D-erythritol 4-phosphate cytidylyltransferase
LSEPAVHHWVVIPAAGVGKRMQSDVPKQYHAIHNKTVLEHTIKVFLQHPQISRVVVVLEGSDSHWSQLDCAQDAKVLLAVGGETRAQSVLNGIVSLQPYAQPHDWVLVHDAARPGLSTSALDRLLLSVGEDDVGGILAVPIADTVKRVLEDRIEETVDRKQLWLAQTPQMFRYQILCEALLSAIRDGVAVTDEASAIERIGLKPKIVMGDPYNIKITTSRDKDLMQMLLSEASK